VVLHWKTIHPELVPSVCVHVCSLDTKQTNVYPLNYKCIFFRRPLWRYNPSTPLDLPQRLVLESTG